ncbi:MAG: acyl carrier protein [Chloroflexi bacterium]|nr:acyl carrier protein [Chloroflexota bacterium]
METRETLKHFIVNDLLSGRNGADIGYDDDLLLSGVINSLEVVRLVTFAEKKFKTRIPPEDVTIEHFATIDTLATYLESRAG